MAVKKADFESRKSFPLPPFDASALYVAQERNFEVPEDLDAHANADLIYRKPYAGNESGQMPMAKRDSNDGVVLVSHQLTLVMPVLHVASPATSSEETKLNISDGGNTFHCTTIVLTVVR